MRLIKRWILSGMTTLTLSVITTRTARWCMRDERYHSATAPASGGLRRRVRAGLPAARQAPRADARGAAEPSGEPAPLERAGVNSEQGLFAGRDPDAKVSSLEVAGQLAIAVDPKQAPPKQPAQPNLNHVF